ncbi:glutamate racemase [Klebsiella pneumoniae]|nr:glutamate racemase [Klebsiella pneumoniae]
MATNLQDGNTPCLAATPSDPRPTVLVFDSGVGGLSVYNEIRQLLPNLHYIYAFDNVAFPYGEKSEEFIVERVVEIVTAVQQRYPLALAVIACNTASTVSLPALREKFAFPRRWRGAGDQARRPFNGERHCWPAGDARYRKASLYP